MNIINFLSKKKTYCVGVIGSSLAVLIAFGVLVFTTQQLFAVALLLASLFGITFRDALNSLTIPTTTTTTQTTTDTAPISTMQTISINPSNTSLPQ
jgi:hypothetical protein